MGQAKRRSAEIMALKAQGPRPEGPRVKDILSFGAYYRDLDDDGVSIAFSIFNEPKPGLTRFVYKTISEVKDLGLQDVRNGTWTTTEIWQQLREAIVSFNRKSFGTEVRPQKTNYNINILDCVQEITIIMGNILDASRVGRDPK